jgi:serine/threonine-protein kinase
MALEPGKRVGSYEVVEPIGSGGMGEVWRATDSALKRDVALKVLPQAFVEDRDRLARFRREAEILASLNHPNIATIHGLEQADGQTVIVMELIAGPTLADRLEEGPIPSHEVMGIALQVAAALEAAHEKGIVHRDLKPANVKLRPDGTIKVLDFGISKPIDPMGISGGTAVAATPAVTQTGIILGTAAYMSPEQARGRFVDQRTDIWAFGCLLFEMLTGQPAFAGEDVMAILARVIDRDTDLSSMPGTISPAVRHTIRLCLQKDPRTRIADIRDVRLALEGAFETDIGSVREARIEAPPWRRAAALLSMLLLGLIVAGSAVWIMRAPEPPQVTKFEHRLPDGVTFGNLLDPVIAVSPQGDMIAYAAGNAVWVRSLDDLEARRLDQLEEFFPMHLVFAPDAKSLAYWSPATRRLMRVDVSGGSAVPITTTNGTPMQPSWAPTGDILFSQVGQILQVPANGGEEPRLLTATPGLPNHPILLPGEKWLLYGLDSSIRAYELETGESMELFPGMLPHYVGSGHLVYFDDGGLLARTFDPETATYGGAVSVVENVLRVAAGSAPQFALSESGTLVYLEGESAGQAASSALAIADTSGNIELLNLPERAYQGVSVSPDGLRIALSIADANDDSEIFIYDLSGQSEIRQLTNSGGIHDFPSWKDARTVLFSSNRDGNRRIYEQSIEGGSATPLTTPRAEGDEHNLPVISPDGKLVFTSSVPVATIMIKAFDGEPEPLINHGTVQAAGSFSPDGAAIAYVAITNSTSPRVYVARYPPEVMPYPADAAGVPVSPADSIGLWSDWLTSEREGVHTLIYQDPNLRNLNAVDVALPAIAFSNRRTLENISVNPGEKGFAPIPGTNRFVVIMTNGNGADAEEPPEVAQRVIVIRNFQELLKERVR